MDRLTIVKWMQLLKSMEVSLCMYVLVCTFLLCIYFRTIRYHSEFFNCITCQVKFMNPPWPIVRRQRNFLFAPIGSRNKLWEKKIYLLLDSPVARALQFVTGSKFFFSLALWEENKLREKKIHLLCLWLELCNLWLTAKFSLALGLPSINNKTKPSVNFELQFYLSQIARL